MLAVTTCVTYAALAAPSGLFRVPPSASTIRRRIPRTIPMHVPVIAAHPNSANNAAADANPPQPCSLDFNIKPAIFLRRLSRFTLQWYSSAVPSPKTSHDSRSTLPFPADASAVKNDRIAWTKRPKNSRTESSETVRAKVSRVARTMVDRTALGGTKDSGVACTSIRRSALPEDEPTSSFTSLLTLSRVCCSIALFFAGD
mmetsp:Transcript_5547/g.24959  ORF Transcript_5547/g.24959 Transcript_5547/m.24959 type:complete len:200 (+) Transcript_5547:481-1080(+)